MPDEDSKALPDISWFAGLFDGEGCIHFKKDTSKAMQSFHLLLQMGMNSEEAIELFYRRFGGVRNVVLYKSLRGPRKLYTWRIYGRMARQVLQELAPHLVVKREQADVARAYYALPWRGSGGRRTADEYAIDLNHFNHMATLKYSQKAS